MKISVIIPTYNRKDLLKQAIDSYLNQNYKKVEIIVVDNASDDGTTKLIEEQYPQIKYIKLKENIAIKAINIGLEHVTGDIVWRTDDDAELANPNVFSQVIEVFSNNTDVDIVGAELFEKTINQFIDWHPYEIDRSKQYPNGIKTCVFSGAGAAIKKEVFESIGGFWGFGYEEKEFCTRAIIAGYKVKYFPHILVNHYSSGRKGVTSDRWFKLSRRHIRYYATYFPLPLAIGKSAVVIFFQMLYGVVNHFSFKDLYFGKVEMFKTFFYTLKNERNPVKYKQIKQITLGQSLISFYLRMYWKSLKNNIKRKNKA